MSTEIRENMIPALRFLGQQHAPRSSWASLLSQAAACTRTAAAFWLAGDKAPGGSAAELLRRSCPAPMPAGVLARRGSTSVELRENALTLHHGGSAVSLPATLPLALDLIALVQDLPD